jgi:tetratricopeptide (TPR) repeat protein
MLTEDGHAKVIDFGLAKLIAPLSGQTSANTFAAQAVTDPNLVMGTVSYMSPEQARGGTIDHRSDIFSFGIVLYEMLAGAPPFSGPSSVETLHAILHAAPTPLPALRTTLAADLAAELQRILDKCLEKDPESRYQGMKDLVVDLRAARRRLDSGATAVTAVPVLESTAARPRWPMAAVAAASVAALVAAVWLLRAPGGVTSSGEAGGKPTVAILPFENNTGSPQMDWLRTGLTDMMVTDLSQSPNVEVLSTDRLVQILESMQRLDDKVISFETVQELARRAGVETVLVGSYVKAGDVIRINTKLQDAATGRIISSERVDAPNEAALFPTIDDLTRRIKARFTASSGNPLTGLLRSPAAADSPIILDRDLKDVTTSSVEAYRYYADAIDLHYRARYAQALPLMQKAVEIDPNFALAHAKLAVLHSNLGNAKLRREHGQRALELSERLTARERLYVEGVHYSAQPETLARAIDAYRRNTELHPLHTASRNNLAVLYNGLQRYDEAIAEYTTLVGQGFEFQGMVQTLAAAYLATGQADRALEVVREAVDRQPASEFAHGALGNVLLSLGQLDEARAALDKAESLSPGYPMATRGRAALAMLREDWVVAEREARPLLASTNTGPRNLGRNIMAHVSLYRGRSREALELLKDARNLSAELLIDLGQPAEALKRVTGSGGEEAGQDGGFGVTLIRALAHSKLGQTAEATNAVAALSRMAAITPSDRDRRTVHSVNGSLALDRRDYARAVEELSKAESMLPRGVISAFGTPRPANIRIWFSIGRAHFEAGQFAPATERFRKIVDGQSTRLFTPLEYVRSLYYLAQIAERQGDRAAARDHYARFLRYWMDGDVDRDKVAEATRKIASL